jgi:hypothetical protein
MLVAPFGRALVACAGAGGVAVPSAGAGVIVVPPCPVVVCAVIVSPEVEATLVPVCGPSLQADSVCASGTTAAMLIRATMATTTPASAIRSDFSRDSDIGRDDT